MGQGDCLSGKEIVKMDYNWKEGLVPSLFSKGMMSKGNFILEVWFGMHWQKEKSKKLCLKKEIGMEKEIIIKKKVTVWI